ncbi:hypothetical protein TWF103_011859, partial [Orbilia oligospora]
MDRGPIIYHVSPSISMQRASPECRRTTHMWGYPSRYPKHRDQNIRLTTIQALANKTSGSRTQVKGKNRNAHASFGLQPKQYGTDQANVSISHQGGGNILTSTISASAVYHETPQRKENLVVVLKESLTLLRSIKNASVGEAKEGM